MEVGFRHSLKTNISPEKMWLEDDPFLLKWLLSRKCLRFLRGCCEKNIFLLFTKALSKNFQQQKIHSPGTTTRSETHPKGTHKERIFLSWHRGSHLKSHRKRRKLLVPTVGGRNPAPPGMYKTLQIMGYDKLPIKSYQLVSRISEPSTVGFH